MRHVPAVGPVVPQECSDCGKKFNVGGPIWSAPIHDQDWVVSTLTGVKSMKDRYPAYNKITSVLTTISEVSLHVSLPPPTTHTERGQFVNFYVDFVVFVCVWGRVGGPS